MLQCAGTALRAGLQRRMLAGRRDRSQLGCTDLTQALVKERPEPSTHADADVSKVAANNAEMMLSRATVRS